MTRTERLFRLSTLLREAKSMRFDEMIDRMNVSSATLKRDLRYLREQLGTPLAYDPFDRTYRVGKGARPRYELPGMWLSEPEVCALALAHRLLVEIDPQSALAPGLKGVIQRVEALLPKGGAEEQLLSRIKLVIPGRRSVDAACFSVMSHALAQRRRVRLLYFTRSRQTSSLRDVSPQRLVHQRAWYLDAWCHNAHALRRFALDAVQTADPLDEPAHEVPLRQLEQLFDGVYGAFTGEPNRWATLLFDSTAAMWVEHEQWHPLQRMRRLSDGRLELTVPYREPAELVMDIMRYGAQVEVQGDAALRDAVRTQALALAQLYA